MGLRHSTAAMLLATFGAIPSAAQVAPVPPIDLVRSAVQNELQAGKAGARQMFRDRRETPQGSQTKLMIETQDSMVGLVIANNDKPLTPQEKQAEADRVERFLKDPEELRKRQRQEKENSERTSRIMKALPDAFLYEYDGTETGRPGLGRAGDPLVRLKFRPNPNYDPPSRVEQVLVGMGGHLLIDEKKSRIAEIDGTLDRDVSFGWGILGHLDRGGRFFVQQGDIGNGMDWAITRMDLSFTGKILLFKSLNFKQSDTFSGFKSVPSDLTFAQGLELLRKQEQLMAENGKSAGL